MNKTLLEKAKEYKPKYIRSGKKLTKEEIEIVSCWLDKKITFNQLEYAFTGKAQGSGFVRAKTLRIMKGMYDCGILTKREKLNEEKENQDRSPILGHKNKDIQKKD